MTPSKLKFEHERAHPESKFFTRENMAFAGDTMGNFRVAREHVTFRTWSGDLVTCWELERLLPVKHGLWDPHFFCVETFEHRSKPADEAGAEASHIWRNWSDGQKRDYCQWTFGARLTLPELAALGVDMSAKVDAYLLDYSRKHRAAGAA